jgi:hypothetical protein
LHLRCTLGHLRSMLGLHKTHDTAPTASVVILKGRGSARHATVHALTWCLGRLR